MYETEGPRRSHLTGATDYSATGVLSGCSTGARKSAWKASFPAFHAPAQTFRFPGPMECGCLADLHTWWCRISTANPGVAQGFSAMKLPILWL